MTTTLDLHRTPIRELAGAVRRGEVSAEQLTTLALDAIHKDAGELGAFLTVMQERALESARSIDAKRKHGDTLGALAGVPIAVKDNLCTKGISTTAASRVLTRDGELGTGYVPPYDATAVKRLREADAVLIGKTNLDELAMGSSTENSGFFACKNPWDRTRTPGGSSGGSAAAVASGMAAAAIGSDTGGSIRQPASFCGVVGMKPTYGRISRYGLIAFASSLDQIGPLTCDVDSAALLYDVLAGPDPRDATTLAEAAVPTAPTDAPVAPPTKKLRIGVPEEYFDAGVSQAVADRIRAVLATVEGQHELVPISLPNTRFAISTYYIIAPAEASSNLARFDGVRYGLRRETGKTLREMYADSRGEGFGREVKRRIVLGTFVLSAGYYDAFYARATRVRAAIRRDFETAFQRVDVIAGPVSPTVAFPLGERVRDPLAMYAADALTLPASLAGLPSLSLPAGTVDEAGRALPVGLQLIAPACEEGLLFGAARAFEAAGIDEGASPPMG